MTTETLIDDQELLDRRYKAYARRHTNIQPSTYDSEVRNIGEHRYVFLRNCNGVLAVYKVTKTGLKGFPDKLWIDRDSTFTFTRSVVPMPETNKHVAGNRLRPLLVFIVLDPIPVGLDRFHVRCPCPENTSI
jgi:hypothetical protein